MYGIAGLVARRRPLHHMRPTLLRMTDALIHRQLGAGAHAAHRSRRVHGDVESEPCWRRLSVHNRVRI
jgi:hypothetical protein